MSILRICSLVLIGAFALPMLAATYTVTNTNDSGPGSLRYAIEQVNAGAADTIHFSIGTGPKTIALASALPPVTRAALIDGRTQPGYSGKPAIELDGSLAGSTAVLLDIKDTTVYALAVNHGAAAGIYAREGSIVRGCYVGLDMTGTQARTGAIGILANGASGSITIGGPAGGDGNFLVATGIALRIGGKASVDVDGNVFGADAAMTKIAADGQSALTVDNVFAGVTVGAQAANFFLGHFDRFISISSSKNVTITGNSLGVTPSGAKFYAWHAIGIDHSDNILIKNNDIIGAEKGIYVFGNNSRVTISENSIHDTPIAGTPSPAVIDLIGAGNVNDDLDSDIGPNNSINYPAIHGVLASGGTTKITGSLSSTPNRTFTIELFLTEKCASTGRGPGRTLVGSLQVTTNNSGTAQFSETVATQLPLNSVITATSTSSEDGTSEFSPCANVQGLGTITSINFDSIGLRQEAQTTILRVNRSNPVGAASVKWTATSATATPGVDFSPASGVLNFAENVSSVQFTVTSHDDTLYEGDEELTITLSEPAGVTLTDVTTKRFSIIDDDPRPQITMSPLSVNEGDSGTTSANVNVQITGAFERALTIPCATRPFGAQENNDYVSLKSDLILAPGATTATITVTINGDTVPEQDETFYLECKNLGTTVQSIVTIVNDDPLAELSVEPVSVVEGHSGQQSVIVTVTSNKPATGGVWWTVRDGTATVNEDYGWGINVLVFTNETSKTISIPIMGDTKAEADEQFVVVLQNASGGVKVVKNEAAVTILNDDPGVAPAEQRIAVGSTASYVIRLGTAAAQSTTMTLTSSAPDVVSVPASATIPAGAIETSFEARALAPSTTPVTISIGFPASAGGTTQTVKASTYLDTNIVFNPAHLQMMADTREVVRVSLTPPSPTAVSAQVLFDTSEFDATSSILIPAGGEATLSIGARKAGTFEIDFVLPASLGSKLATLPVTVSPAMKGPTISSVSPSTGSAIGGTRVEIIGTNFNSNCTVWFGGVQATRDGSTGSTSMMVVTPPHAAGAVAVAVVCESQSATMQNAFTYTSAGPNPPAITLVTPSSGATEGGTLVRLAGTNFDASCWASFAGSAATHMKFVSAAELIAEIPPRNVAGEVAVAVQCASGSSTPANLFHYVQTVENAVLHGASPLTGAPGDLVTLTGIRFRYDDGVELGGMSAEIVDTTPDTHTVRVPSLPAGKVSIDLVDAKNHRSTLGPVFTVTAPNGLAIANVTPSSVPVGGEVLLTGNGLAAAHAFRIGGRNAAILWRTDTQTRLRVALDTPIGTHAIEVLDANGQAMLTGPALNVTATGLLIRAVTPNCATTDGLIDVLVYGTGFTNTTQLRFGDHAATNVTLLDALTLRARIPPHPAGAVTITATHSGATATLTNAFTYHSPLDPNGGCAKPRRRGARK